MVLNDSGIFRTEIRVYISRPNISKRLSGGGIPQMCGLTTPVQHAYIFDPRCR